MINVTPITEMYRHILKLVSNAYYKIYLKNDKSNVWLTDIRFDFSTCEDDFDLPLVDVEICFIDPLSSKPISMCVPIYLDESDDFNIGHIYAIIEDFDLEE